MAHPVFYMRSRFQARPRGVYEVGYTPVTVGREMCECVIAGQTECECEACKLKV